MDLPFVYFTHRFQSDSFDNRHTISDGLDYGLSAVATASLRY